MGLGIARALAAQGPHILLSGFGDMEGPNAEITAWGVQVTYQGANTTARSAKRG